MFWELHFSFCIFLLIIKSFGQDIHLYKNSTKSRCLQISVYKIFCVTTTLTYLYDISTHTFLNDKDIPFTVEESNLNIFNFVYNSGKGRITVFLNYHIMEFDKNGLFLQENLINDSSFLCENLASIFHLGNGNVIVSCILLNDRQKVIHALFKNSVLQRSKVVNIFQTIQGNLECKDYSGSNFICFYLLEFIGFRYLSATIVQASNFELYGNGNNQISIQTDQAYALRSYKDNDIYAICMSTWGNKGLCVIYDGTNNKFTTVVTLLSSEPFSNPLSFEVGKINNNVYVFVVTKGVTVNFIHFNKDAQAIGNNISYVLPNTNYVNSISFILIGNIFESITYDTNNDQNKYLYLHYLNTYSCRDLCYEGTSSTTNLELNLNKYLIGLIKISQMTHNCGSFSLTGGTLIFPLDVTNSLVFQYNNNNFPCEDVIDYDILGSDALTVSQTCKMTFYFGGDKNCPCINYNNNEKLYRYQNQCVLSCPSITIQDENLGRCIYCKDSNKYLYKNQCIDLVDIPSTSFIEDATNNIVADCLSPCLTCQNAADYCLSCIDNYRISPLLPNVCVENSSDTVIEIPTNDTIDEFIEDIDDKVSDYTEQITIIDGDGYKVEITNSSLPNGNFQLSKIDFSECEAILREHYNLPSTENLIFVKIDIKKDSSLIDQVEYCVYDSQANKLDMSLCKNAKITVTYTINNQSAINTSIAEYYAGYGIDIYDAEDPFFNDICYPFTTENDTDISLEDRRNEIYQNLSLCESNCDYDNINLTEYTVTCSCSVKTEIKTTINFDFFSQAFLSVFTDSNFEVVKCYNLIFDSEYIFQNIGFWLFFCFTFSHLPLLVYYCGSGLDPIKKAFESTKVAPPHKDRDYIDKVINNGNYNEDQELRNFRRKNRLGSIKMNNNLSFEEINESDKFSQVNHRYSKSPQKKSIFSLNKINDDNIFFNQHNLGDLYHNNEVVIIEQAENEDKTSRYGGTKNMQHIISHHHNKTDIEREINLSPPRNKGLSKNKNIPVTSNRNKEKLTDSQVGSSQVFVHESQRKISIKSNSSIHSNLLYEVKKSNDLYPKINIDYGAYNQNDPYCKTNTSKDKEDFLNGDKVTVYSKDPLQSRLNSQAKLVNKFGECLSISNAIASLPKEKCYSKIIPSKDYLDDFEFEEAIRYDTRSFCFCYYLSLLTKQCILSTFVYKSPFELKVMRIIMFIFSYSMDFAFNALFYMESMISERYHYEGKLGILFNLQNTIFSTLASTLVSIILSAILNCLSNSKDKINSAKTAKEVKKEKRKQLFKRILKILRIKIIFFIVIEGILMLFFWYYVSCFCAVFRGSQMSWLQGGITSLIIGMLLPFPISFGIVLMRYLSMKKKCEKLFRLSIWLYRL